VTMTVLVHITDLHFGAENPAVVAALHHSIVEIQPTVVLVSGDLTQRARRSQFIAARNFLDSLAAPWIAVPGNHDIPLYNLVARTLFPLASYKKHIANDLNPSWQIGDVVVQALNSAHGATVKDGRLTQAQLANAATTFQQCTAPLRIAMFHHPALVPHWLPKEICVDDPQTILAALCDARVHIVLTGHTHQLFSTIHTHKNNAMLAITGGTACSTRVRNESPSFSCFVFNAPNLEHRIYEWQGSQFVHCTTIIFHLTVGGLQYVSTLGKS
jgi:3',5'-cyclic AMP phosphodiesterase CpdA